MQRELCHANAFVLSKHDPGEFEKLWNAFEVAFKTEQSQKCTLQTRLKAMVPFVPPNPKELDKATSMFIGRASLAQ